MARFRRLAHEILVHLDAQARALRDGDVAIPVFEDRGVLQVVEQVAGGVVVDAQRLLLDEGVVADRVELQVRRQGDGAERAVQRQQR